MDYESSVKRLITSIPERFDVAKSDITQINAVEIVFDTENLSPKGIKRINFAFENKTDKENEE